MIKLYLNTDEFTLGDMLLDAGDFSNLNFICGSDFEGIEEERVQLGQDYGFDVHHGFNIFKEVVDRVEEITCTTSNAVICIDHLSTWLIGVNANANLVEDMYSEYQVDELNAFVNKLIKASTVHNISLLCNEHILQYIIDTVHMNNYTIID